MEASSSQGRSGNVGVKRNRGGGGSGSMAQLLNDDTLRSIFSRLGDHFDLARCSAVCKSWNRIIDSAHLMRDLYYKRNPQARSLSFNISIKSYFQELAMDEHASSLSRGPAEVYQWIGHPMRVTLCRMKSGSILTGVGDKILRLWSAESCKYMNEYNVPNAKMLVDFDFDENKEYMAQQFGRPLNLPPFQPPPFFTLQSPNMGSAAHTPDAHVGGTGASSLRTPPLVGGFLNSGGDTGSGHHFEDTPSN